MRWFLVFSVCILTLDFAACHKETRVNSGRLPSCTARITSLQDLLLGEIKSVVSTVDKKEVRLKKVEEEQEAQRREIQDIRGKDVVQDDDLKDVKQKASKQEQDIWKTNSILRKLWDEVKDFKKHKKELKKEIGDIKTRLTNVETEFSDLKTEVSELNVQISDLNNTVIDLQNKTNTKAAFKAFSLSMLVEGGVVEVPEVFDVGDNYDAGIFTAPCEGIYTFTVCGRSDAPTKGSDLLELFLVKTQNPVAPDEINFPIQAEDDTRGFSQIQCNTYIEVCADGEAVIVVASEAPDDEVGVAFSGSLLSCFH